MLAQRRSFCSAAACDTGVTCSSVTRMVLAYAASCSLIRGVTTRAVPCPANSRVICRWQAPVASISSMEWPVGAVSSTTTALRPCCREVPMFAIARTGPLKQTMVVRWVIP